jgi:hypothetical protein
MLEFFGGWKRKLGVVNLGFACVFAVGVGRWKQISDEQSGMRRDSETAKMKKVGTLKLGDETFSVQECTIWG